MEVISVYKSLYNYHGLSVNISNLDDAKQESHSGPEGEVAVVIVLFGPLDARDGREHALHVAYGAEVITRVMPDLHHEHDQQNVDEAGVKIRHVKSSP